MVKPISENISIQELDKLSESLKIDRSRFKGRGVRVLGAVVRACEQVCNALKRAAISFEMRITYGHSRDAMKELVKSRLQSRLESLHSTLEQLEDPATIPKEKRAEYALALLEVAGKFQADFKVFNTVCSKIYKGKNPELPREVAACQQLIKTHLERGLGLLTELIAKASTMDELRQIESLVKAQKDNFSAEDFQKIEAAMRNGYEQIEAGGKAANMEAERMIQALEIYGRADPDNASIPETIRKLQAVKLTQFGVEDVLPKRTAFDEAFSGCRSIMGLVTCFAIATAS